MPKVNVHKHYTRVTGEQAVKRLIDGGSLYNWEGYECKIDKESASLIGNVGEEDDEWIPIGHISLQTVHMSDWYIPENKFTGAWIHPDKMDRDLEIGDYAMLEGNHEPIIYEVISIDENGYACDRDGSIINEDYLVSVKKGVNL